MPRIEPIQFSSEVEIPLNQIQKTLKQNLPNLQREDQLQELLIDNNCGLEKTIQVIAEIMNFGSDDSLRLRAAENSLKLHRVMNDDVRENQPIFNFVIKGEDIKIQQILQPTR